MENITVTGLIATTPRHLLTQDGLPVTQFRLASSTREFDREAGKWVESRTNWYTVTSFKQLAIHASASLSKGDRVIVTGKLVLREFEVADGYGSTAVEIEADAMGHDLSWGSSTFTRTVIAREAD